MTTNSNKEEIADVVLKSVIVVLLFIIGSFINSCSY